MKLDIVTPFGKVYEGKIKEAYFPGIEGEFGVLEGHAPLITTLKPGVITIKKTDNSSELMAINTGYVEIAPDHINVLVDGVEPISGENGGDISDAIEKAKKLIREASDCSALIATTEAKIESAARGI